MSDEARRPEATRRAIGRRQGTTTGTICRPGRRASHPIPGTTESHAVSGFPFAEEPFADARRPLPARFNR